MVDLFGKFAIKEQHFNIKKLHDRVRKDMINVHYVDSLRLFVFLAGGQIFEGLRYSTSEPLKGLG